MLLLRAPPRRHLCRRRSRVARIPNEPARAPGSEIDRRFQDGPERLLWALPIIGVFYFWSCLPDFLSKAGQGRAGRMDEDGWMDADRVEYHRTVNGDQEGQPTRVAWTRKMTLHTRHARGAYCTGLPLWTTAAEKKSHQSLWHDGGSPWTIWLSSEQQLVGWGGGKAMPVYSRSANRVLLVACGSPWRWCT